MEWLDRMMKALEYMEEHMDEDIDMKEAARVACSSLYHFQRMFHMLTGVTVAEYIRRRRLTLAAQELTSSDIKVIDVALKYGYGTPESFARAFRKVHGVSPSAAREPGVNLKAFPRISFHISLKGDKDMDYKIIEKPAFKVMGKSIRVSNEDGENYKRIPQFWGECYQTGVSKQLQEMADPNAVTGETILGVCMEYSPEQHEFTYMAAVEKTGSVLPEGFEEKEIPAATWAVFESIGPMPDAIQKLWKRIYSEWFPSTGYEPAGDLDMEVYPPGDPDAENYRCQIWIPVVKNK